MQKKLSAIAIALASAYSHTPPARAPVYRWSLARCGDLRAGDRQTLPHGGQCELRPGATIRARTMIVLDKPLFVTARRHAHDPSRRHRARQSAHGGVVTAGEIGGTPGVIIVTQSGKVDWQGEGTPHGRDHHDDRRARQQRRPPAGRLRRQRLRGSLPRATIRLSPATPTPSSAAPAATTARRRTRRRLRRNRPASWAPATT